MSFYAIRYNIRCGYYESSVADDLPLALSTVLNDQHWLQELLTNLWVPLNYHRYVRRVSLL